MKIAKYWKQRALAAEAAIKEVDRIYRESCYPDDIVNGLATWCEKYEKARDLSNNKAP